MSLPESITSSIEIKSKPLNDDRSYRSVTLKNGLEALLIHDPQADKASASLDVHIGYYEDPDDLPGLAHFCEHLLFMGTEKYPSENEYSKYMSQHSGDSNAYTSTEHTNYHFQVGYQHFEGAVDRFAQFFISPLFLLSCKDREVRAVDSENKNNLQNDGWRLQHLVGYLSDEKHPQHKFSTGNIETLETIPNSKNIDVRQRLIEFHNKYYSANIMKLVLLGREDLDTLQDWAVKYFSPIKNKNVSRPIYETPRLNKDHLSTCVFIKPVKDVRRLTLDFPIPDQAMIFETRPSAYMGSVLGHEGEGSILQFLKDKGWATALMAGAYEVSIGQNKFQIVIDLTVEGLAQYKKVIEAVFAFIKLMDKSPVQKFVFEEQTTMSEINFKYQQKASARSTTCSLAKALHLPYPRERILDNTILNKFDPELISEHIKMFNPRSFRAMLCAHNLEVDSFITEHYYGTQYQIKRFDEEYIEKLENIEPNPEFSLAKPNEFIPDDFSVEKHPVDTPLKHPRLISESEQLRVWYKKDDTFWIPKADVRLYFQSPICYASPKNSVSTSLFFSIFEDSLASFAYDAEVAGLGYSVSSSKHGFTIRAQGYNSKIRLLLDHILKRLASYTLEPLRFDAWKERLVRSYQNIDHSNAFYQADYHASYLIEEGVYPFDERLKALQALTADDLAYFGKTIVKQLNLEVLAVGNISKEEVLKIANDALTIMDPEPLPESQTVTLRSLIIPKGKTYQFDYTVQNKDNVNTCVKAIFQVCKLTEEKTRVLLELFSTVAHEPAFNVLRTREQLGYVVFSGIHLQRTAVGFRITVQSERSAPVLQQRIDKFLVEFRTILEALSDADVQKYVDSLIHKKQEKFQNMGEEANSFHLHIASGFYNFLVVEDDVAILKTLNKQDLLNFFDTYVSPSSPTRSILYINIKALKPKVFTPDEASLAVFSNLASKQKVELIPEEAAELAEQAKNFSSPAELATFAAKVLAQKGFDNEKIAKFLEEASLETQDLLLAENSGERAGDVIKSVAWFKARAALSEAPVPFKGLDIYRDEE